MKLLREPLVHFMFMGAFIYLLYAMFSEPAVDDYDKTIIVTTGEIEWMRTAWEKRWNRAPTKIEFDGLIQQYVKETVLYREALTMGLNKHDQVIRRRLAQKLEFLAKDLVALTPPDDAELSTYFEAHQANYQLPARYSFTQVFIDPDKRGNNALNDAEVIKAKLIELGANTDRAAELSDRLMLQNHHPEKTQLDIKKQFGNEFSESLIQLPTGQWHGPVLSGYGIHLVYISRIDLPPPTVLAEVRERVVRDWTAERGETLNKKFYADLREQYTVIIDQAEPEETTSSSEQTQ